MEKEDNKQFIELISMDKYYDCLLKCRQCVHQFECRGPWVYEPWCPKNWQFEQK